MLTTALGIFPLSQEQWMRKSARQGDHVRVRRGVYTHHGVYISHSEVIHFSSLNDDNVLGAGNEVITTSLSRFLLDGELEVRIYNEDEINDLYPAAEIIRWARNSCGDSGYNIIFNNCEHFANWCTLGRFHSQQVNNILGIMDMGFLNWAGSLVSGIFSGSSNRGGSSRSSESSIYNYDPDKVRVAEIEAETAREKVRGTEIEAKTARELSYQENQRIGLIKDAQMELTEFSARMEAAVIEAKVRGFAVLQKSILEMTKEFTHLAQERIVLLEHGHLGAVMEIDSHYQRIDQQICHENDEYLHQKLPKLISLLEQYPEGTSSHKIYSKALDQDYARHVEFQLLQFRGAQERRKMMTESTIVCRKQLEQHVNALVETQMEQLHISLNNSGQMSPTQLEGYRQKLLSNGQTP